MEVRAVTNNQLCNLFGIAGCGAGSLGMGLMFFGAGAGIWIALGGVIIAALALVNYD